MEEGSSNKSKKFRVKEAPALAIVGEFRATVSTRSFHGKSDN
jgi:hypothetical protein